VWFPAPASGQVAVEQLREARNKRTNSLHIIVIPRLFTCLWKRQLSRVADLFLELPFVDNVWTKVEQHEPLTLAFVFPFLSFSPWQLRRAPAFLEMARNLPRMWKENQIPPGVVLRKFLSYARNLEGLPEQLVCMLRSSRSFGFLHPEADELKFLHARNGDFLVFPFQCDFCWFINLKGRSPIKDSQSDTRLLNYIRRVNLDGMWSRSSSTIANVRYNFIRLMKLNNELGLDYNFPELGPWPIGDNVGFQLAITLLKFSQRSGNNETSHLQFDTIRKLRTSFNHVFEVSAYAHQTTTHSFRDTMGRTYINSSCPTQCRLYIKFVSGMLARMGRQTKHCIGL